MPRNFLEASWLHCQSFPLQVATHFPAKCLSGPRLAHLGEWIEPRRYFTQRNQRLLSGGIRGPRGPMPTKRLHPLQSTEAVAEIIEDTITLTPCAEALDGRVPNPLATLQAFHCGLGDLRCCHRSALRGAC